MTWKSRTLFTLHPALLLGEGEGEGTVEDDVGNGDDDNTDDDTDAAVSDVDVDTGDVAVEIGADDDAVAIGGLGVTERVPLLLVEVAIANVPVEVGGVLVAMPEPDTEGAP